MGFFDSLFGTDKNNGKRKYTYDEGLQDGLEDNYNYEKMKSAAYRDGFDDGQDELEQRGGK